MALFKQKMLRCTMRPGLKIPDFGDSAACRAAIGNYFRRDFQMVNEALQALV
jgi:hypothetical protein